MIQSSKGQCEGRTLKKRFIQMALVLAGLGALAVTLQFGASHYGWMSPFGSESKASGETARPAYVMSDINPAFGPECGAYGVDVGGGGHINTDLEYHTKNSIAIVEGTARVAGPARPGDLSYSSDMDKFRRMNAANGINTPFTIKVSKTHKGPEKPEWTVFEQGGLVGCVSYRQTADGLGYSTARLVCFSSVLNLENGKATGCR